MSQWVVAISLALSLSLGAAVSQDVVLIGRTKSELTVKEGAMKCSLKLVVNSSHKVEKVYKCGHHLLTLTEKLTYSEVKVKRPPAVVKKQHFR